MKHGIPFDVAECWSDDERQAHCIIFGEFEGGEFDFARMRWRKKD